ncbi:hypothetical protein EGY25_10720 [Brevundimonas intermedia]|uniref:Uncharacterized protein n=1 Tax=Brevundimonas intermedia TaxID=74315 RepID=A0A4Y9RUA4_9CAUL|nr:hypothetical protein [Brevundimonas intermedia]TFW12473.1 hypothetical protein EGY25_10720 [Brevundimonas intermedia]
MSVVILDDRAFSRIASYARVHPEVLQSHSSPEAFTQAIYRANVEAFRRRYPQYKDARPPICVQWTDEVDPGHVIKAIGSWRYNVALPDDHPVDRSIEAIVQHIAQTRKPLDPAQS